MSDVVWGIVRHCWEYDAQRRPLMSEIATAVQELLGRVSWYILCNDHRWLSKEPKQSHRRSNSQYEYNIEIVNEDVPMQQTENIQKGKKERKKKKT